jgi:beta-lactamase regulating signal transducer with metallopeptidase domain/HEAT repeat protein
MIGLVAELDSFSREGLAWLWNVSWPLALLAPLGWLILRLLPRSSAVLRYGLWWAALGAALLCPLAAAVLDGLGLAVFSRPVVSSPPWLYPASARTEGANGLEPVGSTGAAGGLAQRPRPYDVTAQPAPREKRNGAPIAEDRSPLPMKSKALEWSTVLFLLWASGVLVLLGRLLRAERAVAQVRRQAVPVETGPLRSLLEELAGPMGRRRRPILARVPGLAAPVTIGVWQPCLLLPEEPRRAGTEAPPLQESDSQRAILIHELAHVRRHDYLANLLQRLIEALLWFHPLVWLVSRQLRIEREHVCDDWVLTRTGAATSYAKCLTVLAEAAHASSPLPASVGALHYTSNLERRITMILNDQRPLAARLSVRAALLLAALGLLTAFALAQCMMGRDTRPTGPPAPARSNTADLMDKRGPETASPRPRPSIQSAVSTPAGKGEQGATRPAALERLFQKLDALEQEKRNLARRRWEGLSVMEQAQLILRYERQQAPSPESLAHLTEAEARQVLARWKDQGEQGQRFLTEVPLYLITDQEQVAYEQRRRAIIGEIAALGSEAVPALIDEILHRGPHEGESQEALGQMGKAAVPALLEALEATQEDWARTTLLDALAGTKDSRAREAFLKFLNDPFPHTRYAAQTGLAALGAVPQELYLRCLEDDYHMLRTAAVKRLGEAGDEKAIPALEEIVRHDLSMGKGGFFYLRRDAREALAQIRARTGAKVGLPPERETTEENPLTFEELTECAQSPNRAIRQAALGWLARSFREPRTVEVLLRALRGDQEASVRAGAASSLSDVLRPPHPESPPEFSLALRERIFNALLDRVARDEPLVVRQSLGAIWSLGLRNVAQFRRSPELFSLLARTFESGNRDLQRAASNALSGFGREAPEVLEQHLTPELRQRLLPTLRAGLEDPQVGYRIRFIEVLGTLRDRSIVPRLIELLNDQDDTLRYFAVTALGRIGDAQALSALEQVAANDPAKNEKGQFYVRQAAQEAIQQIRGF